MEYSIALSNRFTTDAITCGPIEERSVSMPIADTPRTPAASRAPKPQPPATSKTTVDPSSICRFAIRSQRVVSANVRLYATLTRTPGPASRAPAR